MKSLLVGVLALLPVAAACGSAGSPTPGGGCSKPGAEACATDDDGNEVVLRCDEAFGAAYGALSWDPGLSPPSGSPSPGGNEWTVEDVCEATQRCVDDEDYGPRCSYSYVK